MIAMTVIGTPAVLQALRQLGTAAQPTLAAGLYQEGESIMASSKELYVPVDTGVLRASGYVEPPVMEGSGVTVNLGYGGPSAPYALAVHENPRAGHTGGVSPQGKKYKHWARVGEWKYLETPWKAAAAGMVGRLEAFLKARIKALG